VQRMGQAAGREPPQQQRDLAPRKRRDECPGRTQWNVVCGLGTNPPTERPPSTALGIPADIDTRAPEIGDAEHVLVELRGRPIKKVEALTAAIPAEGGVDGAVEVPSVISLLITVRIRKGPPRGTKVRPVRQHLLDLWQPCQ